jgi:predicted transcriptional regulator
VQGFGGELEAAVMDRLWSRDEPATVREVLVELRPERDLAYTTVMTVMDNLHRKGFLDRERDGRAYRYRPVKSRDEHMAELMREVLDSSPDRSATLVRFVESMSASEARRLRAMLDAGPKGRRRR